jgi:hypothetical protein
MHTARCRRAHARRLARVDHVEIERDAVTGGRGTNDRKGFRQRIGHTATRDLFHADHPHADAIEQRPFFRLVAARAEHAHVLRQHLGSCHQAIRERALAMTEQRCQRHAVDQPGMRSLRRMAVEMGVDPKQAERSVRAVGRRNTAPGADRARVIATNHERKGAVVDRVLHRLRQPRPESRHRCSRIGRVAAPRLQRRAPARIQPACLQPFGQPSRTQAVHRADGAGIAPAHAAAHTDDLDARLL